MLKTRYETTEGLIKLCWIYSRRHRRGGGILARPGNRRAFTIENRGKGIPGSGVAGIQLETVAERNVL